MAELFLFLVFAAPVAWYFYSKHQREEEDRRRRMRQLRREWAAPAGRENPARGHNLKRGPRF